MRNIKVSRKEVLDSMLQHMNDKNIFCTRIDGSKFLPTSIEEIPTILRQPKSKFYNQTYQRVRHLKVKNLKKIDKGMKSFSLKAKEKATKIVNEYGANVQHIKRPHDLGAERGVVTVTKDTRVQETSAKKLVVNWPTMTCTIEGSLITVDFKI
jgi:ribosomal protein S10|tara:strand:+ start:2105 stop:2563 length:459 start_codon:yes stop_codon:yes gene_type:complete